MSDNLFDLPTGERMPEVVNVVVEIPKGSDHKYEYDWKTNTFRLDRPLFSPMHFPTEYGFIPNTLAEAGDTLDALVLLDQPTFPGCVIRCRPVDALDMLDEGRVD